MQLTLLDANMWLLLPPISTDNTERLDRLIHMVRKLDPDVVTLQEVWANMYLRKIKCRLPKYHILSSEKILFNATGLVTLSKYKPISSEFFIFERGRDHKLDEFIGRKGYLKITFMLGEKKVSVVNTHLHARHQRSDFAIESAQFKVMKESIEDESHVVVAGDLNMPLVDFMKINDGYFRYERNNTRNISNKYVTYFLNLFAKDQTKTDYVLIKNNGNDISSFKSTVIKEPIISDHFPLFSSIVL